MTVLLSMLQARGMWTMCSLHVTIRVSWMFDPHGEDTAGLARNSCCKSVGKGSFRSFRLFIANLLHPGESSRDLVSFHIDRTASNSPPISGGPWWIAPIREFGGIPLRDLRTHHRVKFEDRKTRSESTSNPPKTALSIALSIAGHSSAMQCRAVG